MDEKKIISGVGDPETGGWVDANGNPLGDAIMVTNPDTGERVEVREPDPDGSAMRVESLPENLVPDSFLRLPVVTGETLSVDDVGLLGLERKAVGEARKIT